MKKDKSTKPELSKEEYLKSLFNGAKDELEAYIVSNDQLAADEEPEQADKEDEKSEIKNTEHKVETKKASKSLNPSTENKKVLPEDGTSIMMEVIIINL